MHSASPRNLLDLNFDIDKYLDPYVPRSRLDKLPRLLSHFLGYRDAPRRPIGNIPIALWSFFGGFCGTCVLAGLFMADFIKDKGAPIIIASYVGITMALTLVIVQGAAAILEYNAIESPFSQPRNSVGGQFLAALVGVCTTKLFALNDDFENLRWLAGALSVGIASAVMVITKTVHPPAGATALLAAVSPSISGLGWWYLGIVLLSSTLTLTVACLLNNIHRQYPLYWWSQREKIAKVEDKDEEKGRNVKGTHSSNRVEEDGFDVHGGEEIIIRAKSVMVPKNLYISDEERGVLKILEERLRENKDDEKTDSSSTTATSDSTGVNTPKLTLTGDWLSEGAWSTVLPRINSDASSVMKEG